MFVHNSEWTDSKQHFASDWFVDAVRLIHRPQAPSRRDPSYARRRSTVQPKTSPKRQFCHRINFVSPCCSTNAKLSPAPIATQTTGGFAPPPCSYDTGILQRQPMKNENPQSPAPPAACSWGTWRHIFNVGRACVSCTRASEEISMQCNPANVICVVLLSNMEKSFSMALKSNGSNVSESDMHSAWFGLQDDCHGGKKLEWTGMLMTLYSISMVHGTSDKMVASQSVTAHTAGFENILPVS